MRLSLAGTQPQGSFIGPDSRFQLYRIVEVVPKLLLFLYQLGRHLSHGLDEPIEDRSRFALEGLGVSEKRLFEVRPVRAVDEIAHQVSLVEVVLVDLDHRSVDLDHRSHRCLLSWSGRGGGNSPPRSSRSSQVVQAIAERPERWLVEPSIHRDVAGRALDRGRLRRQRY